MATLDMPYGRGAMPLHVPDARLRAVIAPQRPAAASGTQEDIVRAALAQPIGSPPLHELARGKRRVLIITSDHTRPVPSRITMPLLLEQVRMGSPDAEITILMATGMHRAMTRDELIERFGADIAEKERIVIHQAQRDEDMAFFGTLPSGGELWLNRLAAQSELVIAEGFIEPHFFAGFSGWPGCSAARWARRAARWTRATSAMRTRSDRPASRFGRSSTSPSASPVRFSIRLA